MKEKFRTKIFDPREVILRLRQCYSLVWPKAPFPSPFDDTDDTGEVAVVPADRVSLMLDTIDDSSSASCLVCKTVEEGFIRLYLSVLSHFLHIGCSSVPYYLTRSKSERPKF